MEFLGHPITTRTISRGRPRSSSKHYPHLVFFFYFSRAQRVGVLFISIARSAILSLYFSATQWQSFLFISLPRSATLSLYFSATQWQGKVPRSGKEKLPIFRPFSVIFAGHAFFPKFFLHAVHMKPRNTKEAKHIMLRFFGCGPTRA